MQHYDEQICGGEVRQKGKWEQFVLCEDRWDWRREDSKERPDVRGLNAIGGHGVIWTCAAAESHGSSVAGICVNVHGNVYLLGLSSHLKP